MSLSLSQPLRRARKIAICNVDINITIDINFLTAFIGTATSRYITNDLFEKFIAAPFAFDVHSTTEKATEGKFIWSVRERANPLPLSTSRLFHRVFCSRHPIYLDESVLWILLYSQRWLKNVPSLFEKVTSNRILQEILSFRKKKMITYLTNRRKLFFFCKKWVSFYQA